jgi:hypothetical protein
MFRICIVLLILLACEDCIISTNSMYYPAKIMPLKPWLKSHIPGENFAGPISPYGPVRESFSLESSIIMSEVPIKRF